jgi:hypothetical protein
MKARPLPATAADCRNETSAFGLASCGSRRVPMASNGGENGADACQQALGVHQNVVVEVRTCSTPDATATPPCSDTSDSTSLNVPSIGLIVAGDVVYNQCRMYVGDTTPEMTELPPRPEGIALATSSSRTMSSALGASTPKYSAAGWPSTET